MVLRTEFQCGTVSRRKHSLLFHFPGNYGILCFQDYTYGCFSEILFLSLTSYCPKDLSINREKIVYSIRNPPVMLLIPATRIDSEPELGLYNIIEGNRTFVWRSHLPFSAYHGAAIRFLCSYFFSIVSSDIIQSGCTCISTISHFDQFCVSVDMRARS